MIYRVTSLVKITIRKERRLGLKESLVAQQAQFTRAAPAGGHALYDVPRPQRMSANHVALSFGLVYALPEELRRASRSNNKAPPEINGDESWELPAPATYVIAPDRRGYLCRVDYRKRLETDAILTSLASLRSD